MNDDINRLESVYKDWQLLSQLEPGDKLRLHSDQSANVEKAGYYRVGKVARRAARTYKNWRNPTPSSRESTLEWIAGIQARTIEAVSLAARAIQRSVEPQQKERALKMLRELPSLITQSVKICGGLQTLGDTYQHDTDIAVRIDLLRAEFIHGNDPGVGFAKLVQEKLQQIPDLASDSFEVNSRPAQALFNGMGTAEGEIKPLTDREMKEIIQFAKVDANAKRDVISLMNPDEFTGKNKLTKEKVPDQFATDIVRSPSLKIGSSDPLEYPQDVSVVYNKLKSEFGEPGAFRVAALLDQASMVYICTKIFPKICARGTPVRSLSVEDKDGAITIVDRSVLRLYRHTDPTLVAGYMLYKKTIVIPKDLLSKPDFTEFARALAGKNSGFTVEEEFQPFLIEQDKDEQNIHDQVPERIIEAFDSF